MKKSQTKTDPAILTHSMRQMQIEKIYGTAIARPRANAGVGLLWM